MSEWRFGLSCCFPGEGLKAQRDRSQGRLELMACQGDKFVAESHGLSKFGKNSRQPLVKKRSLQQEMFVGLPALHIEEA